MWSLRTIQRQLNSKICAFTVYYILLFSYFFLSFFFCHFLLFYFAYLFTLTKNLGATTCNLTGVNQCLTVPKFCHQINRVGNSE